jgi:hypothetical protein
MHDQIRLVFGVCDHNRFLFLCGYIETVPIWSCFSTPSENTMVTYGVYQQYIRDCMFFRCTSIYNSSSSVSKMVRTSRLTGLELIFIQIYKIFHFCTIYDNLYLNFCRTYKYFSFSFSFHLRGL